ncbi:MAG: DUF106 domain-containing protein [Thermoplasmata archaeon]
MESNKQNSPKMGMNLSFIYLLIMLFTIIIWGTSSVRDSIGEITNYIFYPVFGFGGKYPILTLIVTGLIITIINMYARHYFIDWYGIAKLQYKTKQLSKMMREAFKNNDKAKVEKLRKYQQKLTLENLEIMNDQMKPTLITFIIGIIFVIWIYYFIISLSISNRMIFLPWTYPNGIDLALGPTVFPAWIIIYMFFTGTVGYFITYLFKTYEFSIRLRNLERNDKK